MLRRPPRSTRTDTLFPYTTLFRSEQAFANQGLAKQYGLLSVPIVLRGLKNSGVALGVLVFNRGGTFPRSGVQRCPKTYSPTSRSGRSEEHTSELQSLMRISYAVFCLKKKKTP